MFNLCHQLKGGGMEIDMKKARIILGGNGFLSYYQKENAEGEAVKRLPIVRYQAILVDGKINSVISEQTDDKVIVEYMDDHVVGIFRQAMRGDEKVLEPFFGVFCIVWFAKRKSKGKIHFLWTNMQEEDYQYVELSCLGIESPIVIALCQHLFLGIKTLISNKYFGEMTLVDTVVISDKQDVQEDGDGC